MRAREIVVKKTKSMLLGDSNSRFVISVSVHAEYTLLLMALLLRMRKPLLPERTKVLM